MTSPRQQNARGSQLRRDLTNQEAASWWDVWNAHGCAVSKARVLANEGLQPCWGRGVPMAKQKCSARDLYKIYIGQFLLT
jgi:2-methylisocitrate lyase-like PEP mutase family enzyme